uniref:Transmembrane protein n=1 Tax=Heterorhabditis bacteriophora TaxID=37862 RepID=A0A1I7WDB7_HETBA
MICLSSLRLHKQIHLRHTSQPCIRHVIFHTWVYTLNIFHKTCCPIKILERGTFNSTPLDVVLSVSPNSRLMNFQHFRLLNNPEPDVPKGKPNGAVRSKLHHSKRLQFVVNNAACCVFHRYANQPIHLLTRHKKQVNWVDLPILAVALYTYVTNPPVIDDFLVRRQLHLCSTLTGNIPNFHSPTPIGTRHLSMSLDGVRNRLKSRTSLIPLVPISRDQSITHKVSAMIHLQVHLQIPCYDFCPVQAIAIKMVSIIP